MAQDRKKDRSQPVGFVSAQDVALKAGVSRSAVSRAFTPGASIAPATREKVMEAALALGYQVNDLARGLLSNRSRLVGLVVTKPEIGFRAELVAAVTKALIARGSVPMLINTGQTEQELADAQRMLLGYRAEATMILSGSPPSDFVDLARRNGQPLVVLGRQEPGADHVRIDNTLAARQAARLLVGRGLKNLAVIGSAAGTPSMVERERVFCEEAARLGAVTGIARGEDATYEGGIEAGRELLGAGGAVQGIFCANDLLAFGVMDYARHERGLSVPGDISVVGFDDVAQADWSSYRLTTFRQDPVAMADRAVDVLERRLVDPTLPPMQETIEPVLIERASVMAAAKTGAGNLA
ncbi:LacI family DNA-binding transcriptional regulator [Radicibacter daui]|uniref:LacI family DNA-binding transcriptional regulator n=1 Tax=Radicibacter daui TaxID=3064829 RepID=UPI004046BF95